MEIKTSENLCIITPLSYKMDNWQTDRLCEEITAHSNVRIGLDLDFVQDCTIEFLNKVFRFKNISVFNINPEVFALFNLMNIDKKSNLFVSEEDFLNNSHRLLNRRFAIV